MLTSPRVSNYYSATGVPGGDTLDVDPFGVSGDFFDYDNDWCLDGAGNNGNTQNMDTLQAVSGPSLGDLMAVILD